jgi:hypothetical protein
MPVSGQETCPLPEQTVLAEMATSLNQAGCWVLLLDREYRIAYMTDELRLTFGGPGERVPVPLGAHIFGPTFIDQALGWPGVRWTLDTGRAFLSALGPWALADASGDREGLRELVDPRLHDILDDLVPAEDPAALLFLASGLALGGAVPYDVKVFAERIRDPRGRVLGTTVLVTTVVGMSTIGAAAALGDLDHFERMQRVARAGRRPAAILFADLEGSSALARRLSTASDPEDATALELDPDHVTYTTLGELTTATEKARRDAPTIPVCEV